MGEFQAIIIMPNSEGLANWWGFWKVSPLDPPPEGVGQKKRFCGVVEGQKSKD